jgi:predicted PurR-regulated permease PerM
VSTAQWQRLAIIGVCGCAAIFLAACAWLILGFLAPVLGLFFGGWLLACLQEPLVGWVMCRTRANRPAAAIASVVIVVVAAVAVGALAAPAIQHDLSTSMARLPSQFAAVNQEALVSEDVANSWLAEHGLPVQIDLAATRDSVAQQLGAASESPLAALDGALGAAGRFGMMLLLSVFFLLGGRQLAEQVVRAFGSGAAPDVRFVLTEIHDAFESFARAQLLQAVLFGAAALACLSVAQVEAAPLVSLLAGAMLLVPVVGSALAIVIPVLATLLWNPMAAVPIAVILVVWEQLVLNVIGPRVMSRQLGMPPLLVLFGILAGGQIAGFWGAVFGIPVLAIALACLEYFRPRWAS